MTVVPRMHPALGPSLQEAPQASLAPRLALLRRMALGEGMAPETAVLVRRLGGERAAEWASAAVPVVRPPVVRVLETLEGPDPSQASAFREADTRAARVRISTQHWPHGRHMG